MFLDDDMSKHDINSYIKYISYEIMHRMMLRGVLKDALEHIPIRNNDLIGVNRNTKAQMTKGQSKQTDKMT